MIYRWCILVVLAAGLLGCKPGEKDVASADLPSPAERNASAARIAQLEGEVRVRDKQIEELRDRADRLARRARKLELMNEQLGKQLAAVGDAPRQRDQHKQQIVKQQLEIDSLHRRIGELERLLGLPASRPATAPADRPD